MKKILMFLSLLAFISCSTMVTDDITDNGGDNTGDSSGVNEDVIEMNERLGVTHTGGKYCLTTEPFIVEGARKINSLGIKTVKFFLSKDMSKQFPYNSDWSATKDKTWAEIVSSQYFEEIFNMDFKTIVFNITDHNQQLSKPDADFSKSSKEIGDLARYLLKKFKDRDITFIIKNWEGDWILRANDKEDSAWANVSTDKKTLRCENFIKWINARQEAIDAAMNENTDSKCQVYQALEANKVISTMDNGLPSVANSVLPYVKVDLVSWSSYDGLASAAIMKTGIDYLSKMHLKKGRFPSNQTVMIGEIGFQEQVVTFNVDERMKTIYKACLKKDVPYIIYWEVYCNEPKNSVEKDVFYPMKTTEQMKGLWLYRPDGTESIACKVIKDFLK